MDAHGNGSRMMLSGLVVKGNERKFVPEVEAGIEMGVNWAIWQPIELATQSRMGHVLNIKEADLIDFPGELS